MLVRFLPQANTPQARSGLSKPSAHQPKCTPDLSGQLTEPLFSVRTPSWFNASEYSNRRGRVGVEHEIAESERHAIVDRGADVPARRELQPIAGAVATQAQRIAVRELQVLGIEQAATHTQCQVLDGQTSTSSSTPRMRDLPALLVVNPRPTSWLTCISLYSVSKGAIQADPPLQSLGLQAQLVRHRGFGLEAEGLHVAEVDDVGLEAAALEAFAYVP